MNGPDDPMGSTEVAERRLRAALAQRADRTEPAGDALDRLVAAADGTSRRDGRRRSAGLVAAAAVIVAVVAVAVAVSRPEPESVDTTDDPAPTTATSPPASTTTGPEDPTSTSAPTTAPDATTAPAPSEATTPLPTTAPPTTTTPPPVLPGASTGPASGSGTGDVAIAQLADVRIGAGDGYDRVVVELLDGHLPDWTVAHVDPPIGQDGSGETVRVAGAAFLLVRMTPASAFDLSGEVPRPTYTGPDRIPGPGAQVVEVVRVGDFEAVSTWAIGLRSRAAFRVTTLTAPARLVIDVATA